MTKPIFIGIAWPYANGPLHVGHLAGAYLPADIFARYQRLRGNRVLAVSGSDCHGTPITLQASREGITPQELIRRNHAAFLKTFLRLGIGFDLFTQTFTANHYAITRQIFTQLRNNGYLQRSTMTGSYSERAQRFLPDRFVEGVCPNCGFERARGDQCDNCGRLLDPEQLIDPHSTLDGGPVSFRDSEHYLLELDRLEPKLRQWLEKSDHSHWRTNAWLSTQAWLREGLRPRAITRDLEWGVPVPDGGPGFADKRIYVWFDAVIGYYSASVEWASLQGQPEIWRDWWENPDARSFYFIGKDNIPFHTIIWPSVLIGSGNLALPYDVAANEFLNYEGQKMSTSRNQALWAHEIEDRYAADAIRYYLAANAPETRDASWAAADFTRRNNDELLATWGNLAHRILTIAYRHFGRVPPVGRRTPEDDELLAAGRLAFSRTGELLDRVQLRAALQHTMSIAGLANQYVTREEPWRKVEADPIRAATVLHTALQTIDYLKTLFSPFLPFSSQKLHGYLGYDGVLAPQPHLEEGIDKDGEPRRLLTGDYHSVGQWNPVELPGGQKLNPPEPLFQRI